MNLQDKIIYEYKSLFPKETLKETANKTKMQLTRIFRIYAGKEMKVFELERFQDIIYQEKFKQPYLKELHSNINKIHQVLSPHEIHKLNLKIEFMINEKLINANKPTIFDYKLSA